MTRLFTDGAEFGDILFWNAGTGVASAAQKRSGSYSYYTSTAKYFDKTITASSEVYIRFGWYYPITDTGYFFCWYGGGTTLGTMRVASFSTIALYVGTTWVVTSDTSFISGGWNLIELRIKIADSPDGIFQLYLNGILTIDFSGDTKPGADTTIDWVRFIATPSSMYFDDIAMNNTSDADGRGDISWCGDGHVELLVANNNGDTNDWVGSDGDSTNNYALVDDIPASGTDYVKASTDIKDMYNVGDYTPTGKIVTRVWAECRAMDNNAQSGSIWLGFKHGGVEYLSSSVTTLSNTYMKVVGDDAKSDPSDSTEWSEADLDAIQFVVECSSSSSSSTTSTSSSTTSSSTTVPP